MDLADVLVRFGMNHLRRSLATLDVSRRSNREAVPLWLPFDPWPMICSWFHHNFFTKRNYFQISGIGTSTFTTGLLEMYNSEAPGEWLYPSAIIQVQLLS